MSGFEKPIDHRFKDMEGMSFGRLKAVEYRGKVKGTGESLWRCVCECGGEITTRGSLLRLGKTKCCGCRHGRYSHGMSRSEEYNIWKSMIGRCENPKAGGFAQYGACGISVCEKWRNSFEAFYSDMGPRPSPTHSLDRFPDKAGNYEPGNVRWATQSQQMRNTRRNINVEFRGVTKCVTDWAKEFGIPRDTVYGRIYRGQSPQEALGIVLK